MNFAKSVSFLVNHISAIQKSEKRAMSKSIKSFFRSGSKETAGGSVKKARLNQTESIATVTVSDDGETTSAASSSVSITISETVEQSWLPCDSMESSWKERLSVEFSQTYFTNLQTFLQAESKSHTIYPPRSQVFSAFNLCPYNNVKVVVIGQDPYHGAGQAHGLAFSVQRGVAIPPSLKNMIKELKSDPEITMNSSGHGNLEHWSQQGVLMLNTVLTVRKADANSHQKKGWEEFTDAVVRELAKKEGLVYLLWGKPAQLKCKNIDAVANTVITSSHPSPLAAYKTSEPFMGSKCFSRCNEALVVRGQAPIDWTIQ